MNYELFLSYSRKDNVPRRPRLGPVLFQDEFRALCRKHGIEIDERYVWD